ncbi:MAG: TonB-dependent receptor [Burkholderiales bacterium]|nr:TonB-dependent receptor [Burkholderiales bacterium]
MLKLKRQSFALAAMAVAVHAATVHAQVAPPATTLPEVVVTGNPLGSDLFELASPASLLQGDELFQRRGNTLGDTLDGLPGVAATGFGPNASRPVIRGLDGDRIRILQNGAGTLDASSLSFDHAVAVDPLVVERAEVVRGPAALFYGGNAVGGVVNVIDNRIPQAAIRGVTGRVETRFGGAAREKATGIVFEAGNGSLALHADVHTRDTDDLRIKGFARSARLRAADPQPVEAEGVLPNSASRSDGGAIGLSHTWAQGYVGISRSGFNTRYGTVAEPDVTIDMQSSRWDLAGEVRELGQAIRSLKFKMGHTDYEHTELDAGVAATRFRNKGKDLHVEAVHGEIGPLRGAIGLQLRDFDFSALGAEAFVPGTSTNAKSVFFFEELPLGSFKLTFGGRHERTEVGSEGGGAVPFGAVDPRFGAAQTRNFSGNSGALGAVWGFMPGLALAVNGSYTERAPTYYELYANGPHAATGVYEVGNSTFGKEKSKAIDISLRLKSGKHSGSITVFNNRFSNYLGLFDSGNTRGADGELNPADAGDGTSLNTGEEILPEFAYRAVSARFRGIEGEARFRMFERGGTLDLLLHASHVRADDRSNGRPLPRIAPWRYGVGVEYRRDRLSARVDATVHDGQDRVATGERPTDGYTMLNAALTYRLPANGLRLEAFLRGINLLNEEARNHVSFLKDVAPLGRRSALLGLRGQF